MPCEVVISAENRGFGDNAVKLGDIIAEGPVGYDWGAKVCLPRFIILTVSDVSVAKAAAFVQKDTRIGDIEFDDFGAPIFTDELLRLSIWKFHLLNLPAAVRQEIEATSRYTATFAKVKPYLRHKDTDEEASV